MTKILIAEDERDIRDLVVFTLQFGGFEVVATGNGAELVSAAPNEKPDLILTDVRMPKMTGYEACQALKLNPETKDIPIVFLSAKGQEEEVNKGMEAGATAYILKPFAPDVLLSKVKEILAQYGGKPAAAPAPVAKPAAPPAAAPAPASAPTLVHAPAPSNPPAAPAPAPTPTPAPPASQTPAATPAPAQPASQTPASAPAPAQTPPPTPAPTPAQPTTPAQPPAKDPTAKS
jgi:CheY-like chemotaxis protein